MFGREILCNKVLVNEGIDGAQACVDYRDFSVTISVGSSISQRRSLYHELCHLYIYMIGEILPRDEEDLCNVMGAFMDEVIFSNGIEVFAKIERWLETIVELPKEPETVPGSSQ